MRAALVVLASYLRREPVRCYSILIAGMALLAYYVPSLPSDLWLALAVAVLGLGGTVRSKVSPTPVDDVDDDGSQ